ncbi:hypothetical protein F4782DRAFT_530491 [Xylaria castorea]|nr:hypothetical protein F4782DRAFT_530491 [Xylaria castorea]
MSSGKYNNAGNSTNNGSKDTAQSDKQKAKEEAKRDAEQRVRSLDRVLATVMEERQFPKTSGQLGLTGTPCQFKLFNSLPPELRQIIWGMFMDSLNDKSELLIHEPSHFLRPSNLTTPTVHTGFPALMRVNLEARSIAQKRVSFVKCPGAQCMVPVRLFRPELDVLYIPWEAWRSFFLLKEFHYGTVWLSQLQHLAVDICLSTNLAAFFRQAQHIPSLRTLRLLVPSAHGLFNPSSMIILPAPIPRCALRPVLSDESRGEGRDEEVALHPTTLWVLPSYLDSVNRNALEAAVAVRLVADPETRAVVERFVRGALKLVIEANVLTKFQYSRSGSGFVEMGEDNVAELVLPVN